MNMYKVPPSGLAVPLKDIVNPPEENPSFQRRFSELTGFEEASTLYTDSGKTALFLVLRALQLLRPGRNEVVLPAWCCPSLPRTVLQAGLKPVLADLDSTDLSYTDFELAGKLGSRTLAVVLVHWFSTAPREPTLTARLGIPLIHDCAQHLDHRNPGPPDHIAFYSFGRGKALNAGHGGALCLSADSPLLQLCREGLENLPEASEPLFGKLMAIHGLSHPRLYWAVERMPFLSIGVTRWQEDHEFQRIDPHFFPLAEVCLRTYETRRRQYHELALGYQETLSFLQDEGLYLPFRSYSISNPPLRYPVIIDNPGLRERIFRTLNSKFGGVTRQYPSLLPDLPGAPPGLFPPETFRGCERICRSILTLPMTAWLDGRHDAILTSLTRLVDFRTSTSSLDQAA